MLKMGLQPINDDEWIEPFSLATLEQLIQHKQSELEAGSGALFAHAKAADTVYELEHVLFRYLAGNPSAYPAGGGKRALKGQASRSVERVLANITFWLPDDICILQPQSDLGQEGGDYVLTAASVLSPSHWRPAEKFLKPLAAIHEPIPGFDLTLTPKITRFFNHLKVGKAVVRYNWGIQPGDALNWQTENEPNLLEEATIHYRSERQTLMRLPNTGAVVFFIRIDLCPLSELAERYQDPLALDKLKAFVRDMPPQQKAYKGIERFPWLFS
ncbi:hypothetical protein A3744_27000 [Oleiphilus sp. HI0073]|jgi:hypothetical protein|nr:hypothetical protein A3744_03300 [Oleiphilus sp. HI0073]KZZ03312.1 hypothetical protein A3744_27000 [Oleiphilus sp. HI0073]